MMTYLLSNVYNMKESFHRKDIENEMLVLKKEELKLKKEESKERMAILKAKANVGEDATLADILDEYERKSN